MSDDVWTIEEVCPSTKALLYDVYWADSGQLESIFISNKRDDLLVRL